MVTDSGTAARVLDVAERLLQVQGYHGFSYADVAEELGITRAALHYHYKGKAELGEALVVRYADRFGAALSELDAAAPGAVAKLHGYVEIYARVLERQRMCLCGMLAAEYQTLPGGMRREVTEFFDLNRAWLQKVLEEGEREATLTINGPTEDAAAMVLGALEGAMLICRMDGNVDRFRAAAGRLLAGLRRARTPAPGTTMRPLPEGGAAGRRLNQTRARRDSNPQPSDP